ncbi:hypothetical protein M8J76_002129 [Diaphorina citri]|nr:hypothetical protein M8J75_014714 [Diaphorina citri]KAI5724188.1 hypothetical protein M8J76_016735 [Diaphorina citri]KAI5724783.1 hypothetical protein M8J77_007143 [Diaphorina citri]KAI5726407.1 hypothetical protein M8J76_002129 [Diaphorina citri]
MVRNYKRKTSWQSWSEESMSQAIIAVRSGEMSLRTAANTHNVPKTTLERKLKKEGDPQTAAHKSLGRFKPVFSDDQEMMLKNYILQMESRLFGLTILDLRSLAYQFAKMNGIQHPFSVQEELAGEDWVEQFLKRQADISLRTPEPTSAARAAAFNRESVKKFFGLLEELVDKYEFPPSRVYNCDETGISTVPNKRSKILSLKGKKQVGSLSSAERGTLITAEICFNAVGQYIPPLLIFPRVRMNPMFEQGLPPETLVECHPSGWMQSEIFAPTWFNHFLKHARPSATDPVLLILDGHSTHVKNIRLVEMARENNVHILVIPPHTSHRMQPLDVGFMAPLGNYYEHEVRMWLRNNPGKIVTVHDVGPLFGRAYIKSATQETALNAFKATGIFPLNSNVFPDHLFLPAETTNREISEIPGEEFEENAGPSERTCEASEAVAGENCAPTQSNGPHPGNNGAIVIDNDPESQLYHTPHDFNTPSNIAVATQMSPESTANPDPITVPLPLVSPEDIRPLPKVANDLGPRRKTKRGKTMILTATPNFDELKASTSKQRNVPETKLKATKRQLINVFQKPPAKKKSFEMCDDTEEYSSDFSSDNSDSESVEKTLTILDSKTLKEGNFILVKLKVVGSGISKEFVGQIKKNNPINGTLYVKFMRNYRQRKDIFVFPDIEDCSYIEKSEVVGKLHMVSKLRHGQIQFKVG